MIGHAQNDLTEMTNERPEKKTGCPYLIKNTQFVFYEHDFFTVVPYLIAELQCPILCSKAHKK